MTALPIAVQEKLKRLAEVQASAERCLQPVGLIGPGDGNSELCQAAYEVAAALAQAGFAIVCGGRGGVMEAASRGAREHGGVAIGLLPEEDARSANVYLTVAIPTGMGEMRNALIARSSVCLVAIGGGMGTLSEIALSLKWEKQVFAMYEEVKLDGLQSASTVLQLIECVANWLLQHVGEPRQRIPPDGS
jgi:uncharacterized protein (TIGR00725 family)